MMCNLEETLLTDFFNILVEVEGKTEHEARLIVAQHGEEYIESVKDAMSSIVYSFIKDK